MKEHEIVSIEGMLDAQGKRFAIVQSRFNGMITGHLVDGAVSCIMQHGGSEKDVAVVKVPGAFEIPLAAKMLAASGHYDALICLGALIRGATPHFDYLASQVTGDLASLALASSVPVAFGVLTTDNIEQAIERAGTKSGNKGWEAAMAAIEMASLMPHLR